MTSVVKLMPFVVSVRNTIWLPTITANTLPLDHAASDANVGFVSVLPDSVLSMYADVIGLACHVPLMIVPVCVRFCWKDSGSQVRRSIGLLPAPASNAPGVRNVRPDPHLSTGVQPAVSVARSMPLSFSLSVRSSR